MRAILGTTILWMLACSARSTAPGPEPGAHSAAKEDAMASNTVGTADTDRYLAELADPDPHVRSHAASELHRLGHPRAVEACLRTLDDDADGLRADHSPSVRCLIEIGWPALVPTLEHLSAVGYLHRARAQRVVEGITKRRFGFDGTAWPVGALERWLAWAQQIDYDADASEDRRAAGLARLRQWISDGGHPE